MEYLLYSTDKNRLLEPYSLHYCWKVCKETIEWWKNMVYCTKCGTKNEEDATVCVKCQQPLGSHHVGRRERRRAEDECFGLPHGGILVGL